jgi:hypothetical protein
MLVGLSGGGVIMELPFTAIVVVIVVIYLLSSIKILAEYERGVIFRLGRLLSYAKGPGMLLVFARSTASCAFRCGRRRWKFRRRTSSPATTSR